MAIVQISQIKHRRGTSENLPQLASAELGWSVDNQKLYIGNGSLEEGAPEIGNTEILTEHSNLPGFTKYNQVLQANTTANVTGCQFNSTQPGVVLTYNITRMTGVSTANVRTGSIRIAQYLSSLAYDEEWSETGDTGVTFGIAQVGNVYCQVTATTTNSSYNANLNFTINSLTA